MAKHPNMPLAEYVRRRFDFLLATGVDAEIAYTRAMVEWLMNRPGPLDAPKLPLS